MSNTNVHPQMIDTSILFILNANQLLDMLDYFKLFRDFSIILLIKTVPIFLNFSLWFILVIFCN